MRLRVFYEQLLGLTISLHADSNEIVVHLQVSADIRLSCPNVRKEIVDTIKTFYLQRTLSNLPIYGVRQKGLSIYTTQESDVAKGISRLPLPMVRLQEEDLIDIEQLALRTSQTFNLPTLSDNDQIDELN